MDRSGARSSTDAGDTFGDVRENALRRQRDGSRGLQPKEESLRDPVAAHFARLGYAVRREVPLNGRIADLIAGQDEQLVAVELKLRDWREALVQAMHYQVACQRAYVAMPLSSIHAPMRQEWRFEREGVGLLAVASGGDVRMFVDASESQRRLPFLTQGVMEQWFGMASRG